MIGHMKEIKFRGLSKTGWVYGDLIHKCLTADGLICVAGIAEHGCYPVEVDITTVGQFIGLQDIEGNDIFQNDICEIMYYTPYGDKTNDFYGKWIVTKWMGQFVLVSGKERVRFTDFANVTSSEYVSNLGTVVDFSTKVNVRVIGNIHQNPELLNM